MRAGVLGTLVPIDTFDHEQSWSRSMTPQRANIPGEARVRAPKSRAESGAIMMGSKRGLRSG